MKLSSLCLFYIKVNPAGNDPKLHVVRRDPTTLPTHSGPTVRPSRKTPKGESVHVKKVHIGVCLCLDEGSRTFSPQGQRSTAQSKPASICSPLRHVQCVSASLCTSPPAAIHFLEVSVTAYEMCVTV